MKFRLTLTPWSKRTISVILLLLCLSGVSCTRTFQVHILEESPPGYVGNLSRYTTNYRSYKLRQTDYSNYFVYNKETGIINTTRMIDRDVLSGLCVNGSNFGTLLFEQSSKLNQVIGVKVFIYDINDNSPEFTSTTITTSIPEESNVGDIFQLPPATDRDCGSNGTIVTYAISGSDASGAFALQWSTDGKSLSLVLKQTLNREAKELYVLNISACDGGHPQRCTFSMVNVTVSDYNDNKPMFHHDDPFIVKVKENCESGKNITTLRVTDADSGNNAMVHLSVKNVFHSGGLKDDELRKLFEIDSVSKVLRTSKCLTYDSANPSYTVVIEAEDQGVPIQRNDITIQVDVVDVNDHSPQLHVYLFLPIKENHESKNVVGVIVGRDEDDGQNGNITLNIVSGNLDNKFYLIRRSSTNTFSLKLNGMLDHEMVSQYNITVEAFDHGKPPLSKTENIVIPVTDVNDNAPSCQIPPGEISIPENSPVGTYITSIHAVDQDGGVNGEVKFVLAGQTTLFQIVESTGLITTNGFLDYETHHSIEVIVIVQDKGNPPLSTNCSFIVNVTDVNDNRPRFLDNMYNIVIQEDLLVGSFVLSLSATDGDEGNNAHLTYDMISALPVAKRTFDLNSATGDVKLLKPLDWETNNFYQFVVMASDHGNPALSSTALVNITIMDVNDNRPVIYPNRYYVNSFHNQRDGFVANVTATDSDSGRNGRVFYEILKGGVDYNFFDIDNETGIVTTDFSSLDSSKTYNLKVIAMDGEGLVSNISTVYITFITTADALPYFEMDSYMFNVEENVEVGTYVGQVKAYITSLTETVSYALYNGDLGHVFSINNIGEIRTSKELDSEEKRVYNIQVLAKTMGQKVKVGWTTVEVVVRDVNDNAPQFQDPLQVIVIKDNVTVGTIIYQARATDPDLGDAGIVKYELFCENNQQFEINPQTGDVSVRGDLSRLGNPASYLLRIMASDSGLPNLTSILHVTVDVTKVNDIPPVFQTNCTLVPLDRNVPINYIFFNVTAYDPDGGTVYFQLSSVGNEMGYFGIFPNGTMFVRKSLASVQGSQYSLSVIATDTGYPPLISTSDVNVYLIDSSTHPSFLQRDIYRFEIEENERPGTLVGKLDLPWDKHFTIMLLNAHADFTFDSTNYEIHTRTTLDREKLSGSCLVLYLQVSYKFQLLSHVQIITVYIDVQDQNDNKPVFAHSKYLVHVEENQQPTSTITKLMMSDDDEGENSKVDFSIVDSSCVGVFGINREGDVILNKTLVNTGISHCNLTVQAVNVAPPYYNSTCQLEITVHDVNNNVPEFEKPWNSIDVKENFPTGQVIFQVTAHDKDTGRNSRLAYIISKGNVDGIFNLDRRTGEITLVRELDFETKKRFVLNITAIDSGVPPLSVSQEIIINVTDFNDNAPQFVKSKCVSEITILENTTVGTEIGECIANDVDSGRNGLTSYSISREKPRGGYFSIDSSTGALSVKKKIDREIFQNHTVYISARDQAMPVSSQLSSTKVITVILNDINDNPPSFSSPPAVGFQPSSAKGDHVVTLTARDPDIGVNGRVMFKQGTGGDAFFNVNIDGQVTFKNTPSPTLNRLYLLKVIAFDLGNPLKETSRTVTVFAMGSDELVFSQQKYTASILENEFSDKAITKVSATSGSNIQYFITSDSSGGLVVLDPNTGVISTEEPLDREGRQGQDINLVVYAVDTKSTSPRTASVSVLITILDENDNVPTFSEDIYVRDVYEDVGIDSKILTLRAYDGDQGRNGSVSYQIANTEPQVFTIDRATGDVMLSRDIDYELNSSYVLNVTATDDGQPQLSSWCLVVVHVLDVNDNAPVFTRTDYSFSVMENSPVGTVLGKIVASDADSKQNGIVFYRLSGDDSGLFSINSQSGVIRTSSVFDRETVSVYVVKVIASDFGKPRALSTHMFVYVSILDENDNNPTFDNDQPLVVDVLEDSPIGTSIATLKATDKDFGFNSKLTYFISGGNTGNAFTISSDGTIVTESLLDRETTPSYDMLVTVSDLASDRARRRFSTTTIRVNVLDVNDGTPYFVSPDVVHLREDQKVGVTFTTVLADDSDTGVNGQVLYELQGVLSRSFFLIDRYTGALSLKKTLDREHRSSNRMNITIEAKDGGQPARLTRRDIVIIIDDVNDNTPIFSPHQNRVMVYENISIGTLLTQLTASDIDQGRNGQVEYAITTGNINNIFSIHPIDGVITLVKPLDRESLSNYTLYIEAFDLGEPPMKSSTVLHIVVLDINDNPPYFQISSITMRVQENVPFISNLCAFFASDQDEGRNGNITYRIENEASVHFLRINSKTGEVSLISPLDRESKSIYSIAVEARDNGDPQLFTMAHLTLIVDDENDNSPVFVHPNLKCSFLEGSSVQSTLCVMNATDADVGSNGKISYELVNDFSRFKINVETGEISTIAELDRDLHEPEYKLIVKAKDGGRPELESCGNVTCRILDIDDNNGTFKKKQYNARIPLSFPNGTFVTAVRATDPDEGLNGEVIYALSTPSSLFYIESATGNILTKQTRSSSSHLWQLTIQALNARTKRVEDTTTVVITATNGIFPVFKIPVKVFHIAEDTKPGFVVLRAEATENPVFRIASGNDNDQFSLDFTSGNLTLEKELDYETQRNYSLWLKASVNTDSTYVNIRVFVDDRNDNKPTFQMLRYQFFLTEGVPPNSTVGVITTEDKDSGRFGVVEYSIIEAFAQTWFHVDRTTGVIYTTQDIDREMNASFRFTVRAKDHGVPSKMNEVPVFVAIVDVNDNPPVFDLVAPVYVAENTATGFVLTKVTARDADEHFDLCYTLKRTGNYKETFSIRLLTGELVLEKRLDRETMETYHVTVHVSDGKYSSETTVNVIVQDIDDNPPMFLKPLYKVFVPELLPIGSFAADIKVTDYDEAGPNTQVFYSFQRTPISDKFRINSTGAITIAATLKYVISHTGGVDPNQYDLTVLAWSPAHQQNKVTTVVRVILTDANDHRPVFEKNVYFTYVPSVSKIGTRVGAVNATDNSDVGKNSEVRYQAVGGNGTTFFNVEPISGYITVKTALTSRVDQVLALEIQARDRGEPAQISNATAKVYIVITVENKHRPVFEKDKYDKTLLENFDVGKELLRVKATDSDSGINGKVLYSILPGKQSNYFTINPHNGAISLTSVKLDYEYKTTYSFDVEARDGAHQSKSTIAIVLITVEDYNDNPPVFQTSPYRVEISENSAVGSVVGVVRATDRDTVRSTITYTLDGQDKNHFSIDKVTGEITTRSVLDYESTTVYQFTVLATDSGKPQKTSGCVVVVSVTGVNEFRPRFSQEKYTFVAAENSEIGKTVGTVTATDNDQGYDGVIQYTFVDPSKNKYFNINETTGEIFIIAPLDSESVSTVNLTVLAKNPASIVFNAGNTDMADVVVKIQDQNDPPMFVQQYAKQEVAENVAKGTQVGNFSAVDEDVKADFNSLFVYRILDGNIDNSFKIIRTGDFAIIVTDKLLDRENIPLFNLTIAAIDVTTPSLVGTATLIVELIDVNDNAPVLKPGICPGRVKENQPKGTVVIRLLDAVDADIDPNKSPYDFLITNNVPFIIEGSELKTSVALDRENIPFYNLSIQVKDSGFPKQSSICFCQIIVEDMNDNPPSAETRQVTVNVPRTSFNDESIGDVSPVDADEVNAYSCEVEGPLYKDVFSFQPDSCILHVKKAISTFYVLNVHARDELSNGVSYSLNISFDMVLYLADQRAVILRLSGISQQHVLNVLNTIQCGSGFHEQILSVRQVSESVTDVLLVYAKDGAYITKQKLLTLLKQCKTTMEKQFGARIELDYNLCSPPSPCINGDCVPTVTLLPENRTTLYSKTHVFVSMYHRPTTHCRCYSGYTGTKCEYSTKPCSSKPCKNGGACISTGVSFVCECQPNFTGQLCETSVNLCNPNPCSNASVCISSAEGPTCQCDFGARGERCELGSFGFHPLSYLKLPTLSSSDGEKLYNVSLQFATVQKNALILLNQNGKKDYHSRFIALEIIEGRLRFSFSVGDVTTRLVANNNPVTDGQWHSVTAVKDKQVGYLSVDGTVYQSDKATVHDATNENLELNNSPLYLGGISSLDIVFYSVGQVNSHDFVGCMRDISFSGAIFDENDALLNNGVIPRCPRFPEMECERCKQGSGCVDGWFTSLCQCKAGAACSHDSMQFTEIAVLRFHFDPSYLREKEFQERQLALRRRRRSTIASVPQTLSMRVKSRYDTGFLWRAADGRGASTILGFDSGQVSLGISGETDMIVSNATVEIGEWFNVTVARDVATNALSLIVDGYRNTIHTEYPYLFIGGTWTFGTVNYQQETDTDGPVFSFGGCLSTIAINNEVLSVNSSNQYGTLLVEGGSLVDGCEPPDLCASSPCSGASTCVNDWQTYRCVASRQSTGSLSVGVIAAIVFFVILVIAIIVAVIAVKKRRTRTFFGSTFAKKTNAEAEHYNSRGSSSTDSIPSRKTPSRNSLDSGVEVQNTNTSLSSRDLAKTASANVISLGSPDEYTIVTSRRDSGSDQRDTGFTDSECEFGLNNLGANLTISSIPSNVGSTASESKKKRPKRSTLNYNKKVPYLINRGYLNDTRRPSRSTSPSAEEESIEMQNYSIDVDEAEHYSIGDASLATYSDINYPSNPSRSLDTDRRYRPSLEHFSESDDSADERQLSNLDHTFENFESGEVSSISSDGGFTISEYDYDRRPSYEQNPVRLNHQSLPTEQLGTDNINNESSVDGDMSWGDVAIYDDVRSTCLAIAQLENDDQPVEIV